MRKKSKIIQSILYILFLRKVKRHFKSYQLLKETSTFKKTLKQFNKDVAPELKMTFLKVKEIRRMNLADTKVFYELRKQGIKVRNPLKTTNLTCGLK